MFSGLHLAAANALTHLSMDKMAAISQIFKCIFKNEKFCIFIQIFFQRLLPEGPIDNKSSFR